MWFSQSNKLAMQKSGLLVSLLSGQNRTKGMHHHVDPITEIATKLNLRLTISSSFGLSRRKT
jgi:hypothetical protein